MNETVNANTFLLQIERRFAAPPDRVFRALTDPEDIRRWWGPEGTRCGDVEIDLRVGGKWAVGCYGPDGDLYQFGGEYREIKRPHRLVKTWLLPKSKAETIVTLTLTKDDGGTRLTLHQDGFPQADFRDSHGEGWNGGFDKLETLLG